MSELTARERAYDQYVTSDRPGSWNRGYEDGYWGEPAQPIGEPSRQAYQEGYEQGKLESDGAHNEGDKHE